MIAYIIKPYTGEIVQNVTLSDYVFPIETAAGETGSATIVGRLNGDYSQYYLKPEGMDYLFKIEAFPYSDAIETKITLGDSASAVDSLNVTITSNPGRISEFNIYTMDAFFPFLRDSMSMAVKKLTPYAASLPSALSGQFNGENPTESPSLAFHPINIELTALNLFYEDFNPEITDDGDFRYYHFNIANVVRVLQARGYRYNFRITSGSESILAYNIRREIVFSEVMPIIFGDGHNFLISESYNDDICSMVYTPIGFYRQNRGRYYLLKDGSIFEATAEDPMPDISLIEPGYSTAAYDLSKTTREEAEEIFSKNTRSHKIEFSSDRQFHIGQPVKLVLSRGIIDTVISKVVIKSDDNRYFYTCGELPASLTEIIKSDSWTYGSRRPRNPREGQLYFEM